MVASMLAELIVGCARCSGCSTGRVCVYMADARCIGVRYRADESARETMNGSQLIHLIAASRLDLP